MTCLIKSKPYETFIHYVDWERGNKQVPHVLKYVIKQAIWCCLVKKCICIYIYIGKYVLKRMWEPNNISQEILRWFKNKDISSYISDWR